MKRNKYNKKIPNWNLKFRDFPTIPKGKRWGDNPNTKEQITYDKLANGNELTKEEEIDFITYIDFYRELEKKLKSFDFETLDGKEIELIIGYLNYAYNWTALIYNKLQFEETYRLIVNESVSGKDESLNNVDYLKYPPIKIVNTNKRFNRANTFETNLFYSSENVDTLIKEIKPEVGKLVTVGVWKVTNPLSPFTSYPLPIASKAYAKNKNVKHATDSFRKMNFSNPLLKRHFDLYFGILGREFTKEVNHHFEYILSSLFAENIFETRDNNGISHFDLMLYPSVAGDFQYSNLAILPSVVDKRLVLDKTFEFRVTKSMYENEIPSNQFNTNITLCEYTNFRYAKEVMINSDIQW